MNVAEDLCTPQASDGEEFNRALDIWSKTNYKICLSQGGMTPHNILVDKNVRTAALIEWETESRMPEYLLGTRALYPRERYVGWLF